MILGAAGLPALAARSALCVATQNQSEWCGKATRLPDMFVPHGRVASPRPVFPKGRRCFPDVSILPSPDRVQYQLWSSEIPGVCSGVIPYRLLGVCVKERTVTYGILWRPRGSGERVAGSDGTSGVLPRSADNKTAPGPTRATPDPYRGGWPRTRRAMFSDDPNGPS